MSRAIPLANLTTNIIVNNADFEKALGGVDSQLAKLSQKLNLFAGAAVAFEVVTKAASALGDALESVIQPAIDLEAHLAKVGKTTGLSGVALDLFRKKIEGFAQAMGGVKLDELLDIASIGGRLGIAGDQLDDFVKSLALVRVAMDDIPVEESATAFARIFNIFHMSTDQTLSFASALNKLDDSSTATGRDILDITRRIAGSAAALGVPIQKVLALSTALKDAGVENEVAGTAISQVFGKMATSTAAFAQVAGVNVQTFDRVLREDAVGALGLFLKGLKQLDAVSQFQVLEGLHLSGARVKGTLLQLEQVMGKIPEHLKNANSEWKTHASILKENEIQGNTTKAQLDRLFNVLQVTAARIGDFFLPVVKALANSFGMLSQDVQKFFERNKTMFEGFAETMTKVGEKVGVFFTNFKDFVGLAKEFSLEKFEQLVTIFDRIGTDVGNNITVMVDNAITIIRNAFEGLATFIESFMERIGKVSALTYAKSFAEAIPPTLRTMIGVINPQAGMAMEMATKLPAGQMGAPDTSGFTRAMLGRGVAAMPGFNNPFAALPNRGPQMAPFLENIAAGQQQRAAEQAQARKEALPAEAEVNPFLDKTPAELRRAREDSRRRARDLAGDQRAYRERVAGLSPAALARLQQQSELQGPAKPGSIPARSMELSGRQQALAREQAQISEAEQERANQKRKGVRPIKGASAMGAPDTGLASLNGAQIGNQQKLIGATSGLASVVSRLQGTVQRQTAQTNQVLVAVRQLTRDTDHGPTALNMAQGV